MSENNLEKRQNVIPNEEKIDARKVYEQTLKEMVENIHGLIDKMEIIPLLGTSKKIGHFYHLLFNRIRHEQFEGLATGPGKPKLDARSAEEKWAKFVQGSRMSLRFVGNHIAIAHHDKTGSEEDSDKFSEEFLEGVLKIFEEATENISKRLG